MSAGRTATIVNPLALPKGLKLTCELCGKPAQVQCSGCRLTYYCDKAHQRLDYEGIHEKICQLLVPLRTPVAVLGSEEERAAREKETRQRQWKLLEISKTEAHKKLFEAKFDLALPPALSALRFSLCVYGPDAVELVPAYLLLGEASIGLKQYAQAEEYLSLAKWSVLKSPGCENSVRAQLHRNFGLLYASQGRSEEAIQQLANDIYFSSLTHGPEDISVTGGYYQLGNIFQKTSFMTEGVSCYDKVVEIWKTFLKASTTPGCIDEAQEAEGVTTLNAIHQFRATHDSSKTTGAAECTYLLAQLYYKVGKIEQAREHGMHALDAYEATLGREHTLTHENRAFLKLVIGDLQTSKGGPRRGSVMGMDSRGRSKSIFGGNGESGLSGRDRSKSMTGPSSPERKMSAVPAEKEHEGMSPPAPDRNHSGLSVSGDSGRNTLSSPEQLIPFPKNTPERRTSSHGGTPLTPLTPLTPHALSQPSRPHTSNYTTESVGLVGVGLSPSGSGQLGLAGHRPKSEEMGSGANSPGGRRLSGISRAAPSSRGFSAGGLTSMVLAEDNLEEE